MEDEGGTRPGSVRLYSAWQSALAYRRLTWREWLILIVALSVAPIVLLGGWWKATVEQNEQQQVAEPFRIASDFYYVGAPDTSAFLITSPAGHVVLDGGRPNTGPKIIASIATLGFDIKDVKVLLNSDPQEDHAGGLAELQKASGAELWASEASAPVIASGGLDPDFTTPPKILFRFGVLNYPPARVDHRFKDGDTIRVGSFALTAHITGGGTRGCTSWSFPVRDRDRVLNVVSACPFGLQGVKYPNQAADVERSLRLLRSLPADIWVTSRSRTWGRYRKFADSKSAKNPVDPFIDHAGYLAYLDTAEADFRNGVVH
jgi:metallo-beta-lactamase class B